MISIGKIFSFEAAHSLPMHEGKCKTLHGHSYRLEVVITGEIKESGMVMDFGDLSKIIKRVILDVYDHSHLNTLLYNPTAELMLNAFRIKINNCLNVGLTLKKLKLWETEKCYAEWIPDN